MNLDEIEATGRQTRTEAIRTRRTLRRSPAATASLTATMVKLETALAELTVVLATLRAALGDGTDA